MFAIWWCDEYLKICLLIYLENFCRHLLLFYLYTYKAKVPIQASMTNSHAVKHVMACNTTHLSTGLVHCRNCGSVLQQKCDRNSIRCSPIEQLSPANIPCAHQFFPVPHTYDSYSSFLLSSGISGRPLSPSDLVHDMCGFKQKQMLWDGRNFRISINFLFIFHLSSFLAGMVSNTAYPIVSNYASRELCFLNCMPT